ncbi:phosphatase [Catellatospora sp. TT07R-123]|nr:phosphatase [Catellatospora sp. TT07R-123]
MATLLLLRHGRTTANADGILAGDLPVELDEFGTEQARQAGARLSGLPLAVVISSPLLRCRQTLDLALPGTPVTPEDGLRECGYGEWSGRGLKELADNPLWAMVQHHPAAVTFPGGEAMAAMANRAVTAVRAWDARISESHGHDAVWLACSHGDVIKAIVADALGMHLDLFQRIQVEPSSITAIRYTPQRPFVLRVNDTGTSLDALVHKHRPPAEETAEGDAVLGGGA